MSAPPELTCRELVELVTDYLDGALPAPDRARFEAHLAGCPDCRRFVAQVRRTIQVAGQLREASIPVAERERLVGLFLGWRAGR